MAVLIGAVADHARHHHGVLTRGELIGLGVTRHQIAAAVDSGELARPHPGVFVAAAAPSTWHQRVLVAVRAGGVDCLASHRTAAHLWGLDGTGQLVPEIVTARHLRSSAVHLGRTHESKDLHLAEPTVRLGVPCTGLTRTILDLGAVSRDARVQAAVDDAIRRRLCTWDDLIHTVAVHSRRGRRGIGPLRRVLDASLGETVPDSRFNRLVQRLLVASGLPPFVAEHEIYDGQGILIARCDLALPTLKLAIELDSRRHHFGLRPFEEDRVRQNRLEVEGWLVLRYTWQAYVDRPGELVAEVASAIRSRSGG